MDLELTIEETNLILLALGKLPAEQSMTLIIKILNKSKENQESNRIQKSN